MVVWRKTPPALRRSTNFSSPNRAAQIEPPATTPGIGVPYWTAA